MESAVRTALFYMSSRTDLKLYSSDDSVPREDKGAQNDAYFDTIWNDQMYLDAIAQYQNESWYDQLLDNPYLRSKQARFETDPLTGLFNYGGAAAKYYGNMRADAMNWLTEKVTQMRQQDYNSAPEQVRRNAAAGINSDLAGNVSPGDAAENDTPVPRSFENGATEYGSQIAQCGLNIITSLMSFGQQIQQFGLNSAQMVSDEINADSSAFDFVVNQIAGLKPFAGATTKEDIDSVDIPGAVKTAEFGLKRFSPRTRKHLSNWLTALSSGDNLAVENVRSELYKKIVGNRREAAEIVSSPMWDDDFAKYVDGMMTHLTKFTFLTDEYSARAQAGQAIVEGNEWFDENHPYTGDGTGTPLQSVYGRTLGAEMAARETSADSAQAASAYQKQMEDAWNELMAFCSPEKGKPLKWYHVIGRVLVMGLRSQIMQPINIGISAGANFSNSRNHSTSFSRSVADVTTHKGN